MSDRNAFFAAVFTRELKRWKKENKSSQEDFAERIGVGPNMITRYKNCGAYPEPDTLEQICAVLGVERSIFYPQTYEEKFCFDNEFRSKVIDQILDMEEALVDSAGINWSFWNYFWGLDIADTMFPFSPGEKVELRIVTPKRTQVSINKEDLSFVKQIQDEIEEYIAMILVKKALRHRLGEGSDVRVVPVLFDMAKDLICHDKDNDDANGND